MKRFLLEYVDRRPLWRLFLGLLLLAVAGLLYTAMGEAPPPKTFTITPVPTTSDGRYDPYAYYLQHNPDPKLVLSPQDAATRAILGCQYPEAQINASPVDKALRDAYGPTGICDK